MKFKGLILVVLVFIMLFTFTSFVSYGNLSSAKDIRVFINQQQLILDVPPQKINNRVLIPLGNILRALGAEVSWDGTNKVVTAKKGDSIIIIPIGSNIAYKNNEPILLDVPASIISGRTLLPLRFLSESLGSKVDWNNEISSVFITPREPILRTTGPTKESTKESINPSSKESTEASFTYKGIGLGSTLQDVSTILGSPKRIDESEYEFKWHIYHDNYKDYVQLGINNDRVVAIYSNYGNWTNGSNINVGSNQSSITATLDKPLNSILKGNVNYMLQKFSGDPEYQLFEKDNYYLTIFYDLHKGNQVSAIQIVDKTIEDKYRRHLSTSADLKNAYERQVFDLANALRVREGLSPFTWDDTASTAAVKHSGDMANNKFFNHYNLKGESPFDRMRQEGIQYQRAAENIAAGQQNAIFAHEGWLNSFSGHREAILGDYQRLGVGVWFGGQDSIYSNYFTQKFYTP